jgi:1-acyl-sn-glycerol-3-phosphate acyltransferase
MTNPAVLPNYGIDADRVLALDNPLDALRRRFDGRYAVDEFGGDPHLTDVLTSLATSVRVRVEHGENIPRTGPALLVANRGVGVIEPVVLALAVRRAAGRRLRVIGAPELPVVGPAFRKVGAIGYRPDDVAALLRAGHLAAAPLSLSWLRGGVGEPPRALLAATLGFPVIPVAIRPGGPLGLPLRPWRVSIGEPLLPPSGTEVDDPLAAAEISESVRDAVHELVART